LGEGYGDSGKAIAVRKIVCVGPSLGFCLVTDKILGIREGFLELSIEN
jgi:hypothetical protein